MAGTVAGGRKAAATNKQRYGKDFYKQMGRKGGHISRGGGFAGNHELAVSAGQKGGRVSRRRPSDELGLASRRRRAVHESLEWAIREEAVQKELGNIKA